MKEAAYRRLKTSSSSPLEKKIIFHMSPRTTTEMMFGT